MAAAFCFTFPSENRDCSATFLSTDGEEYVLKCRVEITQGYGNMLLQWVKTSSKFVSVSIYDRFDALLCEKTVFEKDDTCMALPIERTDTNLIAINITPYVHLRKCMPLSSQSVDKHLNPVEKTALRQLAADLRKLLQTGYLSDIVLTDGSCEIRAHKFILSARSPVFHKMFQDSMEKNQSNRILIQDIHFKVLKELLHFMYTGTVTVNEDREMTLALYTAAGKYDVKDLRDVCETLLKEVGYDNVLETLLLADSRNDKVLTEASLYFISRNFMQMRTLHSWKCFIEEHQRLKVKILNFFISPLLNPRTRCIGDTSEPKLS